MTDGAQRVVGMEYRPVRCLEALSPAGLKVRFGLDFHCVMDQNMNQLLVLCYKPQSN